MLITVRAVSPDRLIAGTGSVETRISADHAHARILVSQTARADPELLAELEAHGRPACLAALADVIDLERPPIVRYHLERMDGGRLVHVEYDPLQVDVYVRRDCLDADVAEELAAHATYLLRHHARDLMRAVYRRSQWPG